MRTKKSISSVILPYISVPFSDDGCILCANNFYIFKVIVAVSYRMRGNNDLGRFVLGYWTAGSEYAAGVRSNTEINS